VQDRVDRLYLLKRLSLAAEACRSNPNDVSLTAAHTELVAAVEKAKVKVAEVKLAAAEPAAAVEKQAEGKEPAAKKMKTGSAPKTTKEKKNRPARNMAEHPPSASVYVCNLAFDMGEPGGMQIRQFFEDCGPIADINWLTNKDTGAFLGRGFVTFNSVEEATKAVAKHGQLIRGRTVELGFAPKRKEVNPQQNGRAKFVDKPLSARSSHRQHPEN
jgi:RNA recognition motif-containing protein